MCLRGVSSLPRIVWTVWSLQRSPLEKLRWLDFNHRRWNQPLYSAGLSYSDLVYVLLLVDDFICLNVLLSQTSCASGWAMKIYFKLQINKKKTLSHGPFVLFWLRSRFDMTPKENCKQPKRIEKTFLPFSRLSNNTARAILFWFGGTLSAIIKLVLWWAKPRLKLKH